MFDDALTYAESGDAPAAIVTALLINETQESHSATQQEVAHETPEAPVPSSEDPATSVSTANRHGSGARGRFIFQINQPETWPRPPTREGYTKRYDTFTKP